MLLPLLDYIGWTYFTVFWAGYNGGPTDPQYRVYSRPRLYILSGIALVIAVRLIWLSDSYLNEVNVLLALLGIAYWVRFIYDFVKHWRRK